MKFKPVPPATDLETLDAVRRSVPLVPDTATDCCTRVATRREMSVEQANTWLSFLRALSLVRETDAGFVRVRGQFDRADLAVAFRERVFGAAEVLAVLADATDSLSADEVFERFEEHVPEWERRREPSGWRARWGERVERLLDWAVVFNLAERTDGTYRLAD